MIKRCSKCKLDKDEGYYNKSKTSKFGLHNHCRECQKTVRAAWYIKNKESEKLKSNKYSKTDAAKLSRKKRYENNKETLLKNSRTRRTTDHSRDLSNKARNRLCRTNLSVRVSISRRRRLRSALKNNVKSQPTINLLGCSIEEFKTYIESKFTSQMTWENYGQFGWHIDHILPCSSFDLTDSEQQKICFHYSNLQPLWWRDNISKGNKIICNT